MAVAVAQRFGRLQRRYGRWGHAYLESLLRSADWSASAIQTRKERSTNDVRQLQVSRLTWIPTNPGQFFACCGLLELADRLWPGAEVGLHQMGGSFIGHAGQTRSRTSFTQLRLQTWFIWIGRSVFLATPHWRTLP